jgi:hypothetical protein
METSTRQQDGRFPKGVSGNPNGRAKGSRNRATRAAEMLLEGEAKALTRVAVDLALDGDLVALKLCLERLIPRRHERNLTFPLPPISEPKHASAAIATIMRGVGNGDVTTGEAKNLVSLVEAALKGHELVDHEARLTALEESHDAKK